MHVQKSPPTLKEEKQPFLPKEQENATPTPPPVDVSGWIFARISVLGVTCYILLSAMMCDEVIAAAVPAIKKAADLDSSQIGLVYSSSFIPSLVFVIMGGLLHNKIGVRALSIVSSILIVCGMVVFAMSDTFWGMVIGRILFGFGLGPTEVVNDIIALRWFDNESTPSIEIAFGTIASFGMLGFVLAFNMLPYFLNLFGSMSEAGSLKMAVLCLAIVPTITVVINVYYIVLDWYAEPILELEFAEEEEQSIMSTIKNLKLSYWLLFTINGSCFALMYVIMLYSVDFMGEKWKYDDLEAGQYSSSVYIAGIIISPITGVVIHRFGQMLTLIFFGVIFFGGGCVVMGATMLHPLVGLISIGTGLGMMETTLWVAVAEIVPESSFGAAFAFLSAAVSIVLVVIPYLAGWLHDYFNSYDSVAYLCAGGAVIGGICTIILYFLEHDKLQKPSNKFKQYFYMVKIVSKKKRAASRRPRRHSITQGEVKQIVGYLTETDAFEDLLQDQESVEPKLVDRYWKNEHEEYYPDTGSLPKDFFSKLVSHEATLVPIEEGHPELEEVHPGITIVQSFIDHDNIALEHVWTASDVTPKSRSRAPSDVPKPKSRTTSDAPKPVPEITQSLPIGGGRRSRTVSDASSPTKAPSLIKQPPKTPIEFTGGKRRKQKPKTKPPITPSLKPNEARTDDYIPDEVWVPDDSENEEPRLRTTSDVTHTNWNKYGRLEHESTEKTPFLKPPSSKKK